MYPKVRLEASTSSDSSRLTQLQCQYKDVVIIGNGPSAIALSYMLSGNWPYYALDAIHPLEFLHHRLLTNRSLSIFHQDLHALCEGLEGRSDNPVSLLFDTLNHPDADLGVDMPSCLSWIHHPEQAVNHVAIGRGLPGGSWQNMEQSSLTLSLEPWMNMPAYGYKDWEEERFGESSQCSSMKRATVGKVAAYYRDFVIAQKLEENFRNHCVVTSVRKLKADVVDEKLGKSHWEVLGHSTWDQTPFCYITPHVVLANGSHDEPNRLHVPGEDLPYVWHDSSKLENLIIEEGLGPHSDPVLIVGAGLTAADAVITARFYGLQVAHAFRRDVEDPALIFNKLPENMYPDYHKVHQMMRQRDGGSYRGYQSYAKHQLVEILPDHKVRIQGIDSSLVLKVSVVYILIGSKPSFSFLDKDILRSLQDQRLSNRQVLRVDAFTHQSVSQKGLFAMGPLVGDNFVRFLQGGALAIASYMAKKKTADDSDKEQRLNDRAQLRWNRVLSCPEGIELSVDGNQLGISNESEMDQTIELFQRRCRFRSVSKRRQQARRRRASHSSCDKQSG